MLMKKTELRLILDQAIHKVISSIIEHDIKNVRNTNTVEVAGDIKGYEEPVMSEFHTAIIIKPSSQYNDRKAKITRWLELSENNLSE